MHKNVIAFSGGRTSGYMLHTLIEKHGRDAIANDWVVLFCNTGREMNETLDFVNEVQLRWQIPIVWLEYTRVPAGQWIVDIYPHPNSKRTVSRQIAAGETTHWFRVTDYKNAKRIGDKNLPFDEMLAWMNVLPNVRARSCTGQMKVRTMTRYLLASGVDSWSDRIGIRSDESKRSIEIIAKSPRHVTPMFPLIENGTVEADVIDFWSRQEFDLKLQSYEGNCDLCFLKTREKKHRIIQERPGSVDWWAGKEREFASKIETSGDGKIFRKAHEYERLAREAGVVVNYAPEDREEISCGCFDGGHKADSLEEAAD
jgi:3'-phosphoadenosine 5'-phosphosulfate sulfotransferase (PAPS reductase)/FAD synthetase